MAVDLRVEMFSVDLFRHVWHKLQILPFVPPRLKSYDQETTEESEYTSNILHAVWFRRCVFRHQNYSNILMEYEQFSESGTDFYAFIQNTFHEVSDRPYTYLNIFDKVLITCAFVAEMGLCLFYHNNKMYIYNAPLCWAMYFDAELKEEFYAKGGWKKFQKYVDYYNSPLLSESKVLLYTIYAKDVDNVYTLFLESFTDYALLRLTNTFKVRYSKVKEKQSCVKCFPFYAALKALGGYFGTLKEDFYVVEGFVQMLLRAMSLEEMEACRSETEQPILNSREKQREGFGENADPNSISNIEKNGDEDPKDGILKIIPKTDPTTEMVRRIFSDIQYNDCEESDWKSNGDLCVFCCKNVNYVPEPFKTQKQFKQINHIKSVISRTIIETTSISTDLSTIANQEFSAIQQEETSTSTTNNESVSSAKLTIKLNRSKLEESANETDPIGVKEALRMFLALGIEPGRSQVLSSLKCKTNGQKVDDENLQTTSHDLPNTTVPEGSNQGHLRSEKISKKKKSKNLKRTESCI